MRLSRLEIILATACVVAAVAAIIINAVGLAHVLAG
jgi:hypothetical protein